MFNRWQTEKVQHLLSCRRGVNLTGARQVGKSTLTEMLTLPNPRRWSLDDDDICRAAADDANGFVKHRQGETVIIDEIQKVPRLLNAIKMVLDHDNSKGQYLLTGSANIRFAKMVKDSLAGRLGVVRLRPLAFAEINGCRPDFLDVAFSRGFEGRDFTGLGKRDVLHLAFAGGYPEARELSAADRRDWFKIYLDDLLEKDIQDITEIRKVETLRKVATSLFAHSAQFIAVNELSAKVELAKVTLQNYIAALKALYLFDSVPAWAKSDYELIGKREKFLATDSALVANILGWNEDDAYIDANKSGKLLETWVYNQLASVAETSSDFSIGHYRDSCKREIDFIVERTDGAMLGIEVKAGSSLGDGDFKHLKWFAKNLAKDEFTGIVLYSGEHTLRFGEGFYAVPLAALGA